MSHEPTHTRRQLPSSIYMSGRIGRHPLLTRGPYDRSPQKCGIVRHSRHVPSELHMQPCEPGSDSVEHCVCVMWVCVVKCVTTCRHRLDATPNVVAITRRRYCSMNQTRSIVKAAGPIVAGISSPYKASTYTVLCGKRVWTQVLSCGVSMAEKGSDWCIWWECTVG